MGTWTQQGLQIQKPSTLDDDTSEEENTETTIHGEIAIANEGPGLQISLHALPGTSSKATTFPLFLHMENQKLVALVDNGSTSSFIDPALIERSGIVVSNHDLLKITIANGNVLWTHAMTTSCSYTIQGTDFTSAFRVLELQGYDIILGCDWIYEYSHVGLNLKIREFTTEKEGTQIKFLDETPPNKNFLVTHKTMKKLLKKGAVGAIIYVQALQMTETQMHAPPSIETLLHQYKQVFAEPTNLPPPRVVDHKIPLLPGAKIVNTRPYMLSHK
jgi:hypothetical protein